MQSENGISIYISVDLCNQKTAYYSCFTYFYTMEMKEKKYEKRGGVGCKKGGCCVLSTSTCDLNNA